MYFALKKDQKNPAYNFEFPQQIDPEEKYYFSHNFARRKYLKEKGWKKEFPN